MRKYRVLHKGGLYYPQVRRWGVWRNFYDVKFDHDAGGPYKTKNKIKYWDKSAAVAHIADVEAQIKRDEEKNKPAEVVWTAEYGEPHIFARNGYFFGWF